MAALTKDRNTEQRDGDRFEFPVATGKKIFAGALVALAAGYAQPGAAALNLIAVGRAEEPVDNTDGADGDVNVVVRRGIFKFGNSAAGDAIGKTEIGKKCFIVDDQTVAKTDNSGARSQAGLVVDIDADGDVWVQVGFGQLP